MKIIHADWEKRNMGINCFEFQIEQDDKQSEIEESINKIDADYIVIKLPTTRPELLFFFQEKGFTFIELMTNCFHDTNLPVVSKIQQRILKRLSCEKMQAQDKSQLFKHIKEGLFKTDRVSLDPLFSVQQATNRYISWISSETKKGGLLYKILFDNKSAGFFLMKKQSDNCLFACIGGIYQKFQRFGLGFFLNYIQIQECRKVGAKKLLSSFSSNNRDASAIHLYTGYTLNQQYYVFTKHKKS